MSLSNDFREFCENELSMTDEEWEKWENRLKEITKQLNRKYYSLDELDDQETDNGLIVGSIGRMTAVRNVSDFDYIFTLPSEVYRRFDNYEGNGQSALLQEIKNELLKRYPDTNIKGDGQVVVIDFSDGRKIELVPAFEQPDGSFIYPDSHKEGSWGTTKPKLEIEKCKSLNLNFNNGFQVSGYTPFENERKLLIFITMDNLSERADYSNQFYDSQTFSWFSKSSRYLRKDNKLTIEGKIAENFYEINVFVKKNNGENFYYLGDVEKVLSAKEIKDSQGKSMVKYIFKLKKDVKKELLDYFNM